MNILTVLAAVLVILAAGQITAFVAIWFRHAIPQSPMIFHWLLLPAMLISVSTALAIAYSALTGFDDVLGVQIEVLALAYFCGAAATWWVLNAYAVYHWRRTQRRRVEAGRGIEERLEHASVEAEDRYSEAELEKREVRDRLDDAAAVSRGELDAAVKEVKDDLARILALLEASEEEETDGQ